MRKRGDSADYGNTLVLGDMAFNLNNASGPVGANGVPRRLTLYAGPIETRNTLNADLGVFAQDSWTIKRLTLNYGVRHDHLHASVAAQHLPALASSCLIANFAAVDNVPS